MCEFVSSGEISSSNVRKLGPDSGLISLRISGDGRLVKNIRSVGQLELAILSRGKSLLGKVGAVVQSILEGKAGFLNHKASY